MSLLKVLVLVHQDCVPPEGATPETADWAHWKTEFYVKKALQQLGHRFVIFGVSDQLNDLQKQIQEFRPSIVFNLLEEFNGEPSFDSHVVAMLELLGVPYTGCNPHGLALGRNKALSKKVLNYHNIPTPGFFTAELHRQPKVPSHLKYPLIVKSLSEEASLGISQKSVVHNAKDLEKRMAFIHSSLGTSALVEEFVPGRELYVGVVGNRNLKVFHPWELSFGDLAQKGHGIATRNVKFNKKYSQKHGIKRGAAQGLSPLLLKRIERMSREVYRALNLSGYARLDFRLSESGQLYFLEANPNAELAHGECLANAAQHAGVVYSQLITKILSLGLNYEQAA